MNIQNTEITRRLEKALNDLQDRFKDIYYENDFHAAINSLKASEGTSARPSKLNELFKMLDACNISYLKGQNTGYYENLINTISLSDGIDVQMRMMSAMLSIYDCYPTPEDYMKRIVDRLENKADGWNNDTLRLRILKQFVKYGEYLPKSGISGRKYIQEYAESKGCKDIKNKDEVVLSLDDGIFSVMELSLEELTAVMGIERKDNSSKKNKLKKKDIIKDKLEILKAADDLATGKFRINGATKQYLYLFAMAYGMTYCTGTDDKLLFDAEKDIDKNLFKDYYTNNFVHIRLIQNG